MREGNFHNRNVIIRHAMPVCCALAIILGVSNHVPAATIPFESPADITLYQLAEQNDPAAQFLIGRKYYTGNAVEKNINAAIKWFELAATQKHTKALFQLGIIYLYGEASVEQNHVYALNYLHEAAKNQSAEAQFELGNYYLMGKTQNVDYPEAIKWYRAAAKQQHVGAMVALGKILNEGRGGVKPQPDQAKQFLSLAAESGNSDAMEYLREIVRNPSATFRNAASESDFHAKLNDASAGHLPSQYEVGMAYLKGNGVDADMKLAAKWLRRAAMNDHADAQYQLSQLYRDGVGMEKNRRRALEWLKIAASAGVKDAQKELHSMHLSNSPEEAFEDFIVKATEDILPAQPIDNVAMTDSQDTDSESTGSEDTKPEIALNKGPEPDSNLSPQYPMDDLYSLDLQPTDAQQQYHLANRYMSGEDLYQDSGRAAYWYEQAAKQNHPQAQYQLGEMYKHGSGVTASVAKAKFWLSRAANAGVNKAEISLRDLSDIQISNSINVIKTSLPATTINSTTPPASANSFNDSNKQDDKTNESSLVERPGTTPTHSNESNVQTTAGMIGVLGKGDPASDGLDKEIRSLIDAANDNEPGAQVRLAEMYRKGRGVEMDLIIAAQWYQKAAAEGDAEAQFELGDMYKQGVGVEKNNALAIKWFRKAANQGHETAKRRLGGCRIC